MLTDFGRSSLYIQETPFCLFHYVTWSRHARSTGDLNVFSAQSTRSMQENSIIYFVASFLRLSIILSKAFIYKKITSNLIRFISYFETLLKGFQVIDAF